MAEKQRRDNLNTNISTMAALVPTVAGSSRRMDKISILRLAAAFLRTQYTLGRGSSDFLPRQFNDLDLEQYFVDNLIGSGGFFIVVTTTGKIVYVSRQVEQHLGHAQNELLGQSLYNFVYPEDHEELTRNITPDEMQACITSGAAQAAEATNENSSSSSSEDSSVHRNEKKLFREQRRCFKLRMSQRTVSRREHTQYECLDISGILRLAEACRNYENAENRTRHREITSTNNDIVFVGMARLPKKRPITELSIIDANKDEYVTRHLVDGRIIYCDHRVSVVAGYLSEEVSGLSAFSFMHKDDFRWTMIGLRQMYDRAETCGSSCYRLLSKTGEFIYLRTHGYLEFDKDTQTVESFVCINTLVSEEEGIELVKEMKGRFSATVSGATRAMIQNNDEIPFDLGSDSQRSNSKASLEDPSQLEDAITYLISDLPSPAVSEDRLSPSPMPNTQFAKAAIISQRLPPAATQASKIGIKKIDHYLVLQGKGNCTPKQEPRTECNKSERTNVDGKLSNSEQCITDQHTIAVNEVSEHGMLDLPNQSRGTSEDAIKEQELLLGVNDSSIEPPIGVHQDVSLQQLDNSPKVRKAHETSDRSMQIETPILQKNCAYKVKEEEEEEVVGVFGQLEKEEPILCYLEKGVLDSRVLSSDSESGQPYTLKRICSDQDIRAISNKKRHSEILYVSTDNEQGVSYVNCRNFVGEEGIPSLSIDFNQHGYGNAQSSKEAGSPISHFREISVDYQQMDSTPPLVISNEGDEQFADLQDLKDDTLLSPGLEPNPDLMMKIFDDLRPVMGFEKTFNEAKMQQLAANNQVVSEEIRRAHIHLANSMALRESQFNILARDLENPALQAQRENLTQLQAEHKMQKKILKTLQQDHHNMQVNMKHNIGV
ncbi:hypothetical protein KM043_015948 [Ampulex compressa]|nr:hypothetical protein KM043_015948 [Ampulex compressa]